MAYGCVAGFCWTRALRQLTLGLTGAAGTGTKPDDVLDACACAVAAKEACEERRLPQEAATARCQGPENGNMVLSGWEFAHRRRPVSVRRHPAFPCLLRSLRLDECSFEHARLLSVGALGPAADVVRGKQKMPYLKVNGCSRHVIPRMNVGVAEERVLHQPDTQGQNHSAPSARRQRGVHHADAGRLAATAPVPVEGPRDDAALCCRRSRTARHRAARAPDSLQRRHAPASRSATDGWSTRLRARVSIPADRSMP